MAEIKPCPACGNSEGLRVKEAHYDCRLSSYPEDTYWVYCTGNFGIDLCEMGGPKCCSKEAAIAAWNALPRPGFWVDEPTEPGLWWYSIGGRVKGIELYLERKNTYLNGEKFLSPVNGLYASPAVKEWPGLWQKAQVPEPPEGLEQKE